MKPRRAPFAISLLVIAIFGVPALSQKRLVDPETARDCGCTLRKWPLLSDVVSKTNSLGALQPETVLPHYADAGCGESPRFPSQGVYGEVRYSKLASLDLFMDHDWHDVDLFLKLDGDAYYLNSIANSKNSNNFLCYNQTNKACPSSKGETLLEAEWDMKHYPERFWASAGDRLWTIGRYVWDCGHPDGYHTEIHSPKAIALTRLEPYILPGDDSPSLINKTYVYINGKSGMKNYSFKTAEGVESVVFDGYKDFPVADQNYEFDAPLPPKPNGYLGQPFAKVTDLPFGGPSPELSIDSAQKFVHVKYPLKLGDPSPERKFAAVIASGWRAPIASVKFRRLTIHVEQIQIRKPHNVVSRSDWLLWLNINGQWTKLEGLPGSDSAVPLKLDRLLNVEGLLGTPLPPAKIDKYFQVIVPDTEDARLTIQLSGWVNIYDALFGSREDALETGLNLPSGAPQIVTPLSSYEGQIGIFFKQFSRVQNFGVGNHNQQNGDYLGELSAAFEEIDGTQKGGVVKGPAETEGDFAVAYTISETRR
jgi:hypothetical protein